MTSTIALVNQKGGVGKTTSTVNLAYALKERGKRVLMVDMDPQASLTKPLRSRLKHLNKHMKLIAL